MRSFIKVVLAALMVVVFAPTKGHSQSGLQEDLHAPLQQMSRSFEQLTREVSSSVVQILVTGYAVHPGIVRNTGDLVTREQGTGSGVILDSSGYIVTNAHVVEGARRIQVVLPPSLESDRGTSILKRSGEIVGAQLINLDKETDLAVLKIQAKDLPYLELGDSDEVRQGQLVFAFGSPLGLENSVTMGIVSSVARQLSPEDPMIYIQTDAPINPGNSGGPLVDASGRVIGINTLIFSQSGGSEGIGFAAPSNIVRNVYEQVSKTGRVRRGEIGVNAQTITPVLAKALGLNERGSVILSDVYPSEPANKVGIKRGDVVVSIDGKPMENGRQFYVNLYNRAVGDLVNLVLMRGEEELTFRVTVIERVDDPTRFADMVSPEKNLIPELGILGLDLIKEIAQMFPVIRNRSGVVVAARAYDAPFWRSGLLPGDIIHEINKVKVKNVEDLRRELKTLKAYDPVVILIERGGRYQYVDFEMS
jgi:serine protease Do